MTLLFFANGETFAAGALPFKYVPATETETTNRILMPVEVQGIRTWAVVDTGAPYVICAPKVAADACIDRASALKKDRMLIRGMRLDGFVYRLNVKLVAKVGEDLNVDATVFVPEVEEFWGDFPYVYRVGGIFGENQICH